LEAYREIPSSLMIYPIPKPSAAVGPNPNTRNAGFPQFSVEKIDVPNSAQPGPVNMAGRRVGLYPVSGSKGTGSGADTPVSLCSGSVGVVE